MTKPRKKVLIVDDEPHILRVLKIKLEKGGFEVITAVNGLEALKIIDAEKPLVLITDIHMPFMDGQQLCLMLQERRKTEPFLTIVVTSGLDREFRIWAEGMENTCFLEKPFSPKSVLKLIREYCQGLEKVLD